MSRDEQIEIAWLKSALGEIANVLGTGDCTIDIDKCEGCKYEREGARIIAQETVGDEYLAVHYPWLVEKAS